MDEGSGPAKDPGSSLGGTGLADIVDSRHLVGLIESGDFPHMATAVSLALEIRLTQAMQAINRAWPRLGQYGRSSAIPSIIKLGRSAFPDDFCANPVTIEFLAMAARDSDERIREAATNTLSRIRTPEAMAALAAVEQLSQFTRLWLRVRRR